MSDSISRQAVIDAIMGQPPEPHYPSWYAAQIEKLPAVQPNHNADVSKKVSISCSQENDLISRQAAIEALARMMPRSYTPDGSHPADEEIFRAQEVIADCIEALEILSPAQPERTCVNCGRTANNGGWYADGRTRCPIEEHYALPKDGYCHLWEKRNVTDDNYPEREVVRNDRR